MCETISEKACQNDVWAGESPQACPPGTHLAMTFHPLSIDRVLPHSSPDQPFENAAQNSLPFAPTVTLTEDDLCQNSVI